MRGTLQFAASKRSDDCRPAWPPSMSNSTRAVAVAVAVAATVTVPDGSVAKRTVYVAVPPSATPEAASVEVASSSAGVSLSTVVALSVADTPP